MEQQFPRTSIFRPGLLARGIGDRWHESLAEYFVAPLKTADLAKAQIADAESAPPPQGEADSEAPVYYEDAMIRHLASAA